MLARTEEMDLVIYRCTYGDNEKLSQSLKTLEAIRRRQPPWIQSRMPRWFLMHMPNCWKEL